MCRSGEHELEPPGEHGSQEAGAPGCEQHWPAAVEQQQQQQQIKHEWQPKPFTEAGHTEPDTAPEASQPGPGPQQAAAGLADLAAQAALAPWLVQQPSQLTDASAAAAPWLQQQGTEASAAAVTAPGAACVHDASMQQAGSQEEWQQWQAYQAACEQHQQYQYAWYYQQWAYSAQQVPAYGSAYAQPGCVKALQAAWWQDHHMWLPVG